MATSKNVATKAEAQLPSTDVMSFFEENEGDGLNYDTSELQIPFLRVIQALSPQIKKSDSAFIPGASMGDVFNTVTGEHWAGEEGITVIPCYQETKYLKFKPRDAGGGFMGELSKSDPDIARTQRTGAKEILPDGNELVKSDQHYCIILGEDGVPSFGIVDMKSTQMKVSRRWKTQLSMLRVQTSKGLKSPPIYGTKWVLKTVEESNDMGSWYNWTLENAGYAELEYIEAGKAFRESVQSGEAKAVAEDVVDEPRGQTEQAPF